MSESITDPTDGVAVDPGGVEHVAADEAVTGADAPQQHAVEGDLAAEGEKPAEGRSADDQRVVPEKPGEDYVAVAEI